MNNLYWLGFFSSDVSAKWTLYNALRIQNVNYLFFLFYLAWCQLVWPCTSASSVQKIYSLYLHLFLAECHLCGNCIKASIVQKITSLYLHLFLAECHLCGPCIKAPRLQNENYLFFLMFQRRVSWWDPVPGLSDLLQWGNHSSVHVYCSHHGECYKDRMHVVFIEQRPKKTRILSDKQPETRRRHLLSSMSYH